MSKVGNSQIEKREETTDIILKGWEASYEKKVRANKKKHSFTIPKSPIKESKRLLTIQSDLRDYIHIEEMLIKLKEMKVRGCQLREGSAPQLSKGLQYYLKQNKIQFGPPFLPNKYHRDLKKELESLQKFVKLDTQYQELQKKMKSLNAKKVIARNKELKSSYNELKSEVEFYQKVNEKGRDGVNVREEKEKLSKERQQLVQELQDIKKAHKLVRHQKNMLGLSHVEMNHNIKLLQNGIAALLHDFDFKQINELVHSMLTDSPHPLDYDENGQFIPPKSLSNSEEHEALIGKQDLIPEVSSDLNYQNQIDRKNSKESLNKFERMKIEIANNTLSSTSKMIDSPQFKKKFQAKTKGQRKGQNSSSPSRSNYTSSEPSIATVAFHTRSIQKKLKQRQRRLYTIEQTNILLHEIEYFINQNKILVGKKEDQLDSDYRFCLKFLKGNKWTNKDSSLKVKQTNIHKIKNYLDKGFEEQSERKTLNKRNFSLPIIRAPNNLDILDFRRKKRSHAKIDSRLFKTEERKKMRVDDSLKFTSLKDRYRSNFSIDLGSTLNLKNPQVKREKKLKLKKGKLLNRRYSFLKPIHPKSRSNSKGSKQMLQYEGSPASSVYSRNNHLPPYQMDYTSGSKISFNIKLSPQLSSTTKQMVRRPNGGKLSVQRSVITLNPMKEKLKIKASHQRTVSDTIQRLSNIKKKSNKQNNVKSEVQVNNQRSPYLLLKQLEIPKKTINFDSKPEDDTPVFKRQTFKPMDGKQQKQNPADKSTKNGSENEEKDTPEPGKLGEDINPIKIDYKRQVTSHFGKKNTNIVEEINAEYEDKTSGRTIKQNIYQTIVINETPNETMYDSEVNQSSGSKQQSLQSITKQAINSQKDEYGELPEYESDRKLKDSKLSHGKNDSGRKQENKLDPEKTPNIEIRPRQFTFSPEKINKFKNTEEQESPSNPHLQVPQNPNEIISDDEQNDSSLISSYAKTPIYKKPKKSILSTSKMSLLVLKKDKSKSSVRFKDDFHSGDESMMNSIHFNLQDPDEIIGGLKVASHSNFRDIEQDRKQANKHPQKSLFQKPSKNDSPFNTFHKKRKNQLEKARSQENWAKLEQLNPASDSSVAHFNNINAKEQSTGYKVLSKQTEQESTIKVLEPDSGRQNSSELSKKKFLDSLRKSFRNNNEISMDQKKFLKIFSRGHSNLFDKQELKMQDVYNPAELFLTDLEKSTTFVSGISGNVSNFTSKKNKRFNTELSSHISIPSSYESLSNTTNNKSTYRIRNPYLRKRFKNTSEKPQGAYIGNINTKTVHIVSIEEEHKLKSLKFTVDKNGHMLRALEICFMGTEKKCQFGDVVTEENNNYAIHEIEFSEDAYIGQVFSGGFDDHLTWIKITEMYGKWVKTVGFDGWEPKIKYWDGRMDYGEEIGEIWIEMNRKGTAIKGMGFISKSELLLMEK